MHGLGKERGVAWHGTRAEQQTQGMMMGRSRTDPTDPGFRSWRRLAGLTIAVAESWVQRSEGTGMREGSTSGRLENASSLARSLQGRCLRLYITAPRLRSIQDLSPSRINSSGPVVGEKRGRRLLVCPQVLTPDFVLVHEDQ